MARKKRDGISQKTRFEVFKRDSFKCQYCGRAAPEVVLHLDHIKPVAKDGDESILNYVTACRDCNAGKGPRELSDQSALSKQRQQLEELNERRAQLEMMLRWREELDSIEDDSVAVAVAKVSERLEKFAGQYLTEHGKTTVAGWVRRYGLGHVLDAIAPAELQCSPDGKPKRPAEEFFDLIGGIARTRKRSETRPHLQEMYYIRGILRRRLSYVNEGLCIRLLEGAVAAGAEIEDLKDVARTVRNWTEFCREMNYRTEPF